VRPLTTGAHRPAVDDAERLAPYGEPRNVVVVARLSQ
jgi:hypothetical protein